MTEVSSETLFSLKVTVGPDGTVDCERPQFDMNVLFCARLSEEKQRRID
jgi:hypothetical protein